MTGAKATDADPQGARRLADPRARRRVHLRRLHQQQSAGLHAASARSGSRWRRALPSAKSAAFFPASAAAAAPLLLAAYAASGRRVLREVVLEREEERAGAVRKHRGDVAAARAAGTEVPVRLAAILDAVSRRSRARRSSRMPRRSRSPDDAVAAGTAPDDDRPIVLLVDEFQWLPELTTGVSQPTTAWQRDWIRFIEQRCALDAVGARHRARHDRDVRAADCARRLPPRRCGSSAGPSEYRSATWRWRNRRHGLWGVDERWNDPRRTAGSSARGCAVAGRPEDFRHGLAWHREDVRGDAGRSLSGANEDVEHA